MSDVQVTLSAPLARFAANERNFTVHSGTLDEVLAQIHTRHPQLQKRLVDGAGKVLPFVSIYLGEDNVRDLPADGLTVPPRSSVLIMSAVAGG
ncbi:hypothetical protein [Amycolatopsis sp. lyj-109]|uniref:hypothetical protein n=1 Tax=Amycolatopsis sp. lyj-109 TaxID=2789287 RepID=UPI00397E6F95